MTTPPISEDGRWWWDGQRWQSLYSSDGRSRWDGQCWQPVAIESATVPSVTPSPSPLASGPAPSSPAADLDRPWWLPEEVQQPGYQTAPPAGPNLAATPLACMPVAPSRSRPLLSIAIGGIALLLLVGVLGLSVLRPLLRGQSGTPELGQSLSASSARFAYQPGTTEKIHFHQTLNGSIILQGHPAQTQSDVDATETLRVISVDGPGNATFGRRIEALHGFLDGRSIPFDPQKAKEAQFVIGPDGRILSGGFNGTAGGTNANSVQVPDTDQFASILPERGIKPGESWHREYDRPNPMGSGTGTIHTSATNTFVRFDDLYGKRVALFQTDAKAPIDLQFNMHDLLKLEGQDDPSLPANATIGYKGTLSLVLNSSIDPTTHELVRATNIADFDLDVSFLNFPKSSNPAMGGFHYGGRQQSELQVLSTSSTDKAV